MRWTVLKEADRGDHPILILIGTVLAIFVLTVVLSLRQQAFMREQRQHSIETAQELLSIIRDNQSGQSKP
jgi:hypothetical protein